MKLLHRLFLLLVPILINSFRRTSVKSISSLSKLLRYKSSTYGPLRMVATEKPPAKMDSFSSGMFTNSSPETKRVIPANMEGKTKMKIVYVVLESQYQSALTKACNAINSGKEGTNVDLTSYQIAVALATITPIRLKLQILNSIFSLAHYPVPPVIFWMLRCRRRGSRLFVRRVT